MIDKLMKVLLWAYIFGCALIIFSVPIIKAVTAIYRGIFG